MANSPGRVQSLDALRGALALYVALHHVGFLYSNWWRAAGNVPWLFLKLTAFGHSAVIGFFLLSGFAIMRAHGGDSFDRAALNRYAFRRVRRLYGVYLGALCVTALLFLGRGDVARAVCELPANLLMLQAGGGPWWRKPYLGNTPLWSLSFEAAYYLLFPVLLLLGRNCGIRILAAAVAAGGMLGLFGVACAGLHDASILALLPVWWLGAWLATPSCSARRWRAPSWLAGYGLGLIPLLCRSLPESNLGDLATALAFLPLFVRLTQEDPAASRITPSLPLLLGLLLLHALGARFLLAGTHSSTRNILEFAYLAAPGILAGAAPLMENLARRSPLRSLLLGLCGISYGLYAVHFPVLAFGRDFAIAREMSPAAALGLAGGGLAVALILAKILEDPWHRTWANWLNRRWPR